MLCANLRCYAVLRNCQSNVEKMNIQNSGKLKHMFNHDFFYHCFLLALLIFISLFLWLCGIIIASTLLDFMIAKYN